VFSGCYDPYNFFSSLALALLARVVASFFFFSLFTARRFEDIFVAPPPPPVFLFILCPPPFCFKRWLTPYDATFSFSDLVEDFERAKILCTEFNVILLFPRSQSPSSFQSFKRCVQLTPSFPFSLFLCIEMSRTRLTRDRLSPDRNLLLDFLLVFIQQGQCHPIFTSPCPSIPFPRRKFVIFDASSHKNNYAESQYLCFFPLVHQNKSFFPFNFPPSPVVDLLPLTLGALCRMVDSVFFSPPKAPRYLKKTRRIVTPRLTIDAFTWGVKSGVKRSIAFFPFRPASPPDKELRRFRWPPDPF